MQETSAALFTTGEGIGQAAALNQDGTVNNAANPAARGTVMTLYATGAGTMRPPVTDGKPAMAQLSVPERQVHVSVARAREVTPFRTVDGFVPVQVLYAGGAPSLVAGALQINIRLPEVTKTGSATPVLLEIGGYGVLEATVAVK